MAPGERVSGMCAATNSINTHRFGGTCRPEGQSRLNWLSVYPYR